MPYRFIVLTKNPSIIEHEQDYVENILMEKEQFCVLSAATVWITNWIRNITMWNWQWVSLLTPIITRLERCKLHDRDVERNQLIPCCTRVCLCKLSSHTLHLQLMWKCTECVCPWRCALCHCYNSMQSREALVTCIRMYVEDVTYKLL
jgi:hypothetical protein